MVDALGVVPRGLRQTKFLQVSDMIQGHCTLLRVIRLIVWQKHVIFLLLPLLVAALKNTSTRPQAVSVCWLLHAASWPMLFKPGVCLS